MCVQAQLCVCNCACGPLWVSACLDLAEGAELCHMGLPWSLLVALRCDLQQWGVGAGKGVDTMRARFPGPLVCVCHCV